MSSRCGRIAFSVLNVSRHAKADSTIKIAATDGHSSITQFIFRVLSGVERLDSVIVTMGIDTAPQGRDVRTIGHVSLSNSDRFADARTLARSRIGKSLIAAGGALALLRIVEAR